MAQNQDNAKSVTMVAVRQVAFTGNTVFSGEVLAEVIASALGIEVEGLEALRALAAKVEAYYHAHGYPNARVVLPEQEVAGGRVTFQVIEPKLGEVRLTGNQRYSDRFLRKSLNGIDHQGVLSLRAWSGSC